MEKNKQQITNPKGFHVKAGDCIVIFREGKAWKPVYQAFVKDGVK